MIKSIVARPCSHAVPLNLPPPDWWFHPLYQWHSVNLLPPNSYTAHFNPLFQNVHLPLLSNLFHYSIKCHTLLTTPTRSSLIQPYSSPPTLTLSVQHPALHSFQTPASVRPSAAALCDESCGEYFPHELGLLTLVVRLGCCYD